MMKKAVICFFILMQFCLCHANDEYIPLFTYWNKGDVKEYNYQKSRIDKRNGGERISNIKSRIKMEVLDMDDESYTVSWKYYDYHTGEKNPIAALLIQKLAQQEIIFKIDQNGSFIDILNIDQLIEKTEKSFTIFEKTHPKDSEIFNSEVYKQLKQTYVNKELFKQYAAQDIQRIHQFYAYEYSIDTPTKYETIIPVPLLLNYKMHGTSELMVSEAEDSLTIESKIYAEHDEIIKLVKLLVSKFGPAEDKTASATDDFFAESLKDAKYSFLTTATFDIESGWLNSYTYSAIANVGIQNRTDTTTITLIK